MMFCGFVSKYIILNFNDERWLLNEKRAWSMYNDKLWMLI